MSVNDDEKKIHIANWTDFLQNSKTYFRANWMQMGNSDIKRDFIELKTINKSPFGIILLTKHRPSQKIYALKVVEKAMLVYTSKIKRALYEKRVLQSIRFPFTIHLEFFFQENTYLYYGLPFVSEIELFGLIRQPKKLDNSVIKFYAAQVLLALEYLHFLDLVHRDIKPENIVIDKHGYLKLNDFSLCRVVKCRTYTFCGTPEYMAPEVIFNKGYGKSVDYWAFGVLIYEMAVGVAPFQGKNQLQLYENIVQVAYRNPSFLNKEIKDLIKNLLQLDLSRRLGVMKNGVDDIKDHKYFRKIPWLALINKKLVPPPIPTPLTTKWSDESFHVSRTDRFGHMFKDF